MEAPFPASVPFKSQIHEAMCAPLAPSNPFIVSTVPEERGAFEIVTPQRVDEAGDKLPSSAHFRRKRRSLDEVQTELWDSDHVHYRISAFGKHYHLNLTLDAGFIAPLYTVTVLGAPQGANRTDAEGEGEEGEEGEEDTELRHCFYRGHVDAQEQHAAVISLCSGLVSFYARSERTHAGTRHTWLFHSVHCRCS